MSAVYWYFTVVDLSFFMILAFFFYQSYSFLNLCRQTKIHNIGATLVGVDKFGNKYYEKLGDTQYGKCPALSLNLYVCGLV